MLLERLPINGSLLQIILLTPTLQEPLVRTTRPRLRSPLPHTIVEWPTAPSTVLSVKPPQRL